MPDIARANAAYDAALVTWRGAACEHTTSDTYADPVTRGCRPCEVYGRARDTFLAAVKAHYTADRAAHPENYTAPAGHDYDRPIGREAVCTVCGQGFNPADDTDLIHITTYPTGTELEIYCGGRGELTGAWY